MMGWRGRIGWLVPPGNPTMEPEIMALTPEGVGSYFTRMRASGKAGTHAGQEARNREQFESIEEAAALLMMVQPQALMLGHASLSTTVGREAELELIDLVRRSFHVPLITAMDAVVQAFEYLGVKHVAYATPYDEPVTLAGERYLANRGITVANMARLGSIGNIYEQPPSAVYQLGRRADHPQAQAVFISGIGLPSLAVVETLERDLRKPVITGTLALMWLALRTLGINEFSRHFGSLLRGD